MSMADAMRKMANKPHMAHINNTLVRKDSAKKAKSPDKDYAKYREAVDKALALGYTKKRVIMELEAEIDSIERHQARGDKLYQDGVRNAKESCKKAIRKILNELIQP